MSGEQEEMRAVWVLQEFTVTAPPFRYSGGWDPIGTETSDEECHWHDLGAAIAWARARAPRVVLHLCVGTGWSERASFSAGETRIPELPAWNAGTHAAVGPVGRERGYAGVAGITEEPYEFEPLETFRLVEETQMRGGDRSVIKTSVEHGLTLDAAVDLARRRSEVVVVGTGWPGSYEYENAGSKDYVPEPYPRFYL